MALGDAASATALEHGMGGDEPALLQDVDLGGSDLDLDGSPARAVRDGVEIAADRNHTLVGDASLEAKHGVERPGRQPPEGRLLLCKVLHDDAPRGAVQAAIGDLVEPLGELGIQVVQAAETAGEEEVLADVAERPLHLAFGFRPVGTAGFRDEAVVGASARSLSL